MLPFIDEELVDEAAKWYLEDGPPEDDFSKEDLMAMYGCTDYMLMNAWFTPASTAVDYCDRHGHDFVDRSTAGPDSGSMDYECVRCGAYFHHQLY